MRIRRAPATTLLAIGLLVAGLLTAAPAFAAAPTITSFTPTSGPAGTPVVITGTNFVGPAVVHFNGNSAGFGKVVSSTQLTVKVPLAATTGAITVRTPGGLAASSAAFTVTPRAFVAPAVGPPGTTITLTLSGFRAAEALDVYVDTTRVALRVTDSAGQLSAPVTIPASVSPGIHWVSAVARGLGNAAQAAFRVRTDWPQYGYVPSHVATNSYENQIGAGNVADLKRAWRLQDITDASPAIVGGVVYEGFVDRTVRALTEQNGRQRWSFATGGPVSSSPAVVDGTVYVGSDDGYVYALAAHTGDLRWRFRVGTSVRSSPAVIGGSVYIGGGHYLYALSAATGALRWRAGFLGDIVASPTVADGDVYIGSIGHSGGWFGAVSTKDGSFDWSQGSLVGYIASAVVNDGQVYISDAYGHLSSYDAEDGGDGEPNWTYSAPDGEGVSGVAVANGRVYFATGLGWTVVALDATDGTREWLTNLPTDLSGGVTVANGLVYATGGTRTYVLSAADGRVTAGFNDGSSFGYAVVLDGTLTVGGYNTSGLVHYTLPTAPPAAVRPELADLRPPSSP